MAKEAKRNIKSLGCKGVKVVKDKNGNEYNYYFYKDPKGVML